MEAWKYTAEIEMDGVLVLRVFYVKASDQNNAFAALKREHPGANVLGSGAQATEEELLASGGTFLRDEEIRCVRI
jgi:hypothetical protein